MVHKYKVWTTCVQDKDCINFCTQPIPFLFIVRFKNIRIERILHFISTGMSK